MSPPKAPQSPKMPGISTAYGDFVTRVSFDWDTVLAPAIAPDVAHLSLSLIPRTTRKATAMTDLIFLGATILSFAVCIAYLVAYKKL